MKNMLRFIKFIWDSEPLKIIIEVVLCIYQAVADFFVGVYLYYILLSFVTSRSDYKRYIVVVLIILAISVIRGLFQGAYHSYYKPLLSLKLNEKISAIIHEKQSSVVLSAYENPEFYDLMKRACDNVRSIPDKIMTSLCNFTGFMITSFLTIIFVSTVDAFYVLFFVFPVLHSIAEKKFSSLKYKLNCEFAPQERKQKYVLDTVFSREAAKDIRTTDIYSSFQDLLKVSENDSLKIRKTSGVRMSVVSFLSSLFGSNLPLLSSCFYTSYSLLIANKFSLADAAVLVSATILFCNRLNRIGNYANAINATRPYINDWFTFIGFAEEDLDTGDVCGSLRVLKLKNVSFSYTPGIRVLSNVDLEIRKGEKLCIVGMNGAGKTSFVKLLLGLYPPDRGEILYNGRSLTEYSLRSYRNQFAVAFQDYQIYAASVAENILMDIPTSEDTERINYALESVGLADKVKSFENGIKSVLSKEFDQQGEILSGGQYQKISVARLFAKEYEIAILDEPSAKLDPIAEKNLYENLLRATEGKTVIYISHNLSSALLADRILLFQDGSITEEGTHCELMALKGQYAEMFNLQAGAYTAGKENVCEE